MRFYLSSDQLWRIIVVILGALIIIQLIFAPQVYDVTIYTYRIMKSYYVQDYQRSLMDYDWIKQNASNWSSTQSPDTDTKPHTEKASVQPDVQKMITISMSNQTNATTLTLTNSSQSTGTVTTASTVLATAEMGIPDSNGTCQPMLGSIFVYNEQNNSTVNVSTGGEWQPANCKPASSLALIIPFRERHSHLRVFLPYIHAFLQRQKLHYRIYVIEQYDNFTFNRAKLMNIGYREASKDNVYDCYVFHDVDLLPLDERIGYNCSKKGPLHMASGIDKFGFNMPYGGYFGGACAFTPAQLEKINGFSNRYFGWGGEDDDIAYRISYSGQQPQRYPTFIGRYHMIKHGTDKGNEQNPERGRLLQQSRTIWKTDGLNSLKYERVAVNLNHLYTNVRVQVSAKQ